MEADASGLAEYHALDPEEQEQFMALALSNYGLLLGPPSEEVGVAGVAAERARIDAREELMIDH